MVSSVFDEYTLKQNNIEKIVICEISSYIFTNAKTEKQQCSKISFWRLFDASDISICA